MDDFSIQPGVPNAFGLIGAEANAIAPGKRPLSSMSPTIVLKNDEPILAVGAAGGPTIITQPLLAINHTIDYGLGVKAALAQPHFHHQWAPNQMRIERKVSENVLAELRKRGHTLKVYNQMAEPKWVVAYGVCTVSGGFYDNYTTVMGIDTIVPVDLYIPGCPPRPEMVIDGLINLQQKVQKETLQDHVKGPSQVTPAERI